MPPQAETNSSLLRTNCEDGCEEILPKVKTLDNRQWRIVWRNVALFSFLHLAAVYGLYLFLFKIMWRTNLYVCCLIYFSGLGITAGAHRLWSHKSYKARLPLQILLVIFNTIALQDAVVDWVREHRMHHKYSETDADPHNAKRGFFFSHIGWLLIRKHPDIKAKGHTIDLEDVRNDPVLKFQKRYYRIIAPLACFVIPPYVATLWGESPWNAFFVCAMFRYAYTLNGTWLVNSAAHIWGTKPYDKNINPTENKIVSHITFGEGFHNYHHTFPWDYKTAELGTYSLNLTKLFIDIMAKIGWAYDLKTVSEDVIQKRILRTGDGSKVSQGATAMYSAKS
ncbi:acyl-CoA Delta-9 desaturase-like [Anticarsia gemmatalis]|uniref:acyl-CoA Delta-9 desaturase-like n=1 Tax=Anticarsia gemmatalis TaxID=129554 RepID=UPI003F772CCA